MRSVAKFLGSWMLLGAWACSNAAAPSDGKCTRDRDHSAHCGEIGDAKDYASYSCTGSARPDDDPKYVEGVPEGIVCANHGEREAGVQGYCCTTRTTSCAYNPVAICDDEGSYGYQCRGANRPDALNAALSCGNGVEQGRLVNYCCTGTAQEAGCLQSDSAGCPSRLMGFTCRGENLPRGEQLGANKSRSDFYRLLCSAPKAAANPEYKNYCCYAPAPLPPGGSCIGHTEVPGCDPGRFGFACYGPETPQEDYLPMRCPEPGKTGVSAEGYPATLYCCDFH
jgi:hypothetical protein